MEKDTEIHFKPLSNGLGFHPFENGLPYQHVPKPRPSLPKTSGAGAVVAGPVRFAPQKVKFNTTQSIPTPIVHFVLIYLGRLTMAFLFDTSVNFIFTVAAFLVAYFGLKLGVGRLTDDLMWASALVFLVL